MLPTKKIQRWFFKRATSHTILTYIEQCQKMQVENEYFAQKTYKWSFYKGVRNFLQ